MSKKTLLVLVLALVALVPATVLGACKDTKKSFRITLPGTGDGTMRGNCKWVARSKKDKRCGFDGVSAACPVTCGTCATCADPADIRFKFKVWNEETKKKDKTVWRGCEFVQDTNSGKRDQKLVNNRCKASGNVCRATCGVCETNV